MYITLEYILTGTHISLRRINKYIQIGNFDMCINFD